MRKTRQKKYSGLLLLIPFLSLLFSGSRAPEEFDVVHFNKMFKTARWLYRYDMAFWAASGYLTENKKETGGERHFCYQDRDSLWHVIFLETKNDNMVPAYHLTVDHAYKVRMLPYLPDSTFTEPVIKALYTAQSAMKRVTDSLRIRFNFYIRKNNDRTFTIWAFPGIQPDGMIVYGAEFMFVTDAVGEHILQSSRYMQKTVKGYSTDHPPGKIMLDYRDVDEPTLGGILFVWENKGLFPKILLVTRKNISTVVQDHTGQYYWLHLDRP